MLEMLKTRKEQLQAEGKKGFTLMEMLIVIAIIAILIAIAIPIFTSQLRAAELATDTANMRSAYAEAVTDSILDSNGRLNSSVTITVPNVCTHCTPTVSGNSIVVTHNADNSLSNSFNIDSDVTVTISGS